MKINLTSLLLACGAVAASPLISLAQDAKPPQETVKPAEPNARQRPDGDKKPEGDRRREAEKPKHEDNKRGEHRERPKAPEGKPVTYLGLLTRGLSPELAAQVGVPEGFGLLVADIMDGSPAKEAGIQKYDVIILLGDQRIVNAEQFQALIRVQKKGDDVTLTIRRKGEESKISAKLGERVMPAASAHGHHPMGPPMLRGEGPGAKFLHHSFPDAQKRIEEAKKRMEHLRGAMRERFQNRGEGPRGPGSPPPHSDKGPMKHDGDRSGPPAPPRGGPPPMHRDGDRDGPHANRGPGGPDGKRPGDDHGPRAGGPQGNGPRPDGEAHRDGGRPGSEQQGDRGPRAGAPQSNGPRPGVEARRDGGRPEGDQGNRGPRPDGPPQGGPRPDVPRGDTPKADA